MIYCVCNSINTAKVDTAVSCGARSAKCVLAHHGKKFNCGQCVSAIKERLCELNDATQLQAAE
jgi:bacterioferritin-associated ferredoxin